MKIVLGTNNTHKLREIREILAGAGCDIALLSMRDFPDFPDPEETETTFAENALIKARAAAEFTGLPAVADDSGLEIDALDGRPGVFSARYAGPGCTFDENNRKVLRELEGIAASERAARFVCVAAYVPGPGAADDAVRCFRGVVEGVITDETRGDGGFGYDPIFFVPELGRTFAEATAEKKHAHSHRGDAFRRFAEYLGSLRSGAG